MQELDFHSSVKESPVRGQPVDLSKVQNFRDPIYPASSFVTSVKTCVNDGLMGDMKNTVVTSIQAETADTESPHKKWNKVHGTSYAQMCRRFWLNEGNCIRSVKMWSDKRGVRRIDMKTNKGKTYVLGLPEWPLNQDANDDDDE